MINTNISKKFRSIFSKNQAAKLIGVFFSLLRVYFYRYLVILHNKVISVTHIEPKNAKIHTVHIEMVVTFAPAVIKIKTFSEFS